MTDNEIIKALEKAMFLGDASIMKGFGTIVDKKLLSDTVDLINRQKAEIDKLNKKVEELSEVLSDHIKIRVKEIKSEAIKEFGKFLIDKSENGIISISDIPEYVTEMVDHERSNKNVPLLC